MELLFILQFLVLGITAIEVVVSIEDTSRCDNKAFLLVNDTIQKYLWEDLDIKKMDECLDPVYKELFKKADIYRKLGKDNACFFEEISFLQGVVEWMILLKERTGLCADLAEFEEVYEEFKVKCVKDELTCRFNSFAGQFIDKFIDILGIRVPLTGVSYMAIDDDECQVFIVHP